MVKMRPERYIVIQLLKRYIVIQLLELGIEIGLTPVLINPCVVSTMQSHD